MGGFTRPRDLRSSNWWPGGRYRSLNKVYELPPSTAYEPHTVFLLESRYRIKHGVGRVDSYEHIVGVCREGDLPAVLAHYNSSRAPSEIRQNMDNARWPWMPPKVLRRHRWWGKGENPLEVRQNALDDIDAPPPPPQQLYPAEGLLTLDVVPPPGWKPPVKETKYQKKQRKLRELEAVRLLSRFPNVPAVGNEQVRAFSASSSGSESNTKPKKDENATLDVDKALKDGVLSASTTIFPNKIPAEVKTQDSTVQHVSGYVSPTPTFVHRNQGLVANGANLSEAATAGSDVDDQVGEVPFSIEPAGDIPPTPATNHEGLPTGLGKPRGFHSSAQLGAAEVPMDINKGQLVEPFIVDVEADAVAEVETEEIDGVDAEEGFDLGLLNHMQLVEKIRNEYMPTLSTTPFWRPLLTATFSTRPLAMTHARMSRALPQGLPYHASINNEDRKTYYSFSGRMRGMRLERMQNLTVDIARLLDGWRGGFLGVRFHREGRGRGIEGEDFEHGLPFEKRLIKYGVGAWYPRADEILNGIKEDLESGEFTISNGPSGKAPLETFKLDDFGMRLDENGQSVPWPQIEREGAEQLEEIVDQWNGVDLEFDAEDQAVLDAEEGQSEEGSSTGAKFECDEERKHLKNRTIRQRRQELGRDNGREIASALALDRAPRGVVTLPRH